MPKFRYVALDAKGRESQGIVEAESQTRAIAQIRDKGFFPTRIEEIGARGQPARRRAAAAPPGAARRPGGAAAKLRKFFERRVGGKDLSVFTRQLATLIDAGVAIVRSLQTLAKQGGNPTLTRAIVQMTESVEGGSTFAEALAQQPRIFDKFYVNMVRAGEAGGVIETVLERMSEFLEKSQRLKRKVKGAMVYPCVVLLMAFGILTFMLLKIIPQFASVFSDLLEGKPLPALTRVVIAASNWTVHNGPVVIGVIALFVVAVKLIRRTEKGRYKLDQFKLHSPIFGSLISKTAIANFTRTLGTLLTSGVPILQAMNIVREIVGNEVIARCIAQIHDSVKEGEAMSVPMESSRVFPVMVVSMVDVGEETGALPEMLMKIADNYDEEVDAAVEALTSIIEPVMIVCLAGIVGTIVVAMFMPLVELIKGLGQ